MDDAFTSEPLGTSILVVFSSRYRLQALSDGSSWEARMADRALVRKLKEREVKRREEMHEVPGGEAS